MSEQTCQQRETQWDTIGGKMQSQVRDIILLTPYPVEPGHTLITIARLQPSDWRPEMRSSASYVAEGDNAGIVINKPASIMDYNKSQASQKEHIQRPNAKMSFKVFLINSETSRLTLEHRTLRFWLAGPTSNENNGRSGALDRPQSFVNLKQESSQLAQTYFRCLVGQKPNDDFPKNYVAFIMKLMRLLKTDQFARIGRMEVELRQLSQEDEAKPPSRASSIDGSQSSDLAGGRESPLTSQKILDIIESSYPNPISIKDICSTTQTADEALVKQFLAELSGKEKINSTDNGQHYTRTVKPIDTKVNLVKQMPKVIKSQQPVIAILTSQYCEKLAVDSMISDKETFVRYQTTGGGSSLNEPVSSSNGSPSLSTSSSSSANYVYTLGNIGDHRVVSTKLTSIGDSRGALIAAGNATTRLLGTFPDLEYVFLVGCGGGVVNYTDFASHTRLGDVVISHLAQDSDQPRTSLPMSRGSQETSGGQPERSDFVYVHCKPKQQDAQHQNQVPTSSQRPIGTLPVSYSIHKNLKKVANGFDRQQQNGQDSDQNQPTSSTDEPCAQKTPVDSSSTKPIEYDECHFRLWRPARLELQELTQRLWLQGLDNPSHRIWEYYIDEGIKTLKQQDIDASRPAASTDKLFISTGPKDTIEVSHPEANEDEIDLRKNGRPMCHFGPIGSGKPAAMSDSLKQRMISEFNLRAFDSEFDPVVESIYGNCKECYVMIRGISDYKDGRKKKEWQQYSALVAAAFMKSIIINLKPF